ncbi:delta fatty acid desaturase [Actinocatenispora thailandica]|uniref:Delta fatty acid desaturase n=1 Tax=Actinocatenispora thailandica TaxID=227318 RepID=A0A7R7HWV2_9ACTN|nr:acyl-CoA desaturase [Actinocatenispora thailandica]BCJ34463.1 delta fatty acid desaturase [Actinocatenispora thailandica]
MTVPYPKALAAPEPWHRTGSDYAELSRRIRRAGLLRRRTGYYGAKMAINGVLFVAGWVAVLLLGNSWYQLIVAAALAVVFTQLAFVGHDAGHQQIFRSHRINRLVGMLHGNFAVGLSFGWWVSKHNRHHANPNDEDRDPDVAPGALVFVEEHTATRRGLAGLLTRSQAYLFFPMLLLEGFNLHVASVRALLRPSGKAKIAEVALLVAHIGGYLTILLLVMSPVHALVFAAVQQGLFGLYMGCSFAPNHKGMPTLRREDNVDYLRRQVLTSRNVRGGRFVDFALGGLNYQIEHHLFPSMPRPNLRRSQPLIQAFCTEYGVSYRETGLLRSYREALRHLHEVGAPLRRAAAAETA